MTNTFDQLLLTYISYSNNKREVKDFVHLLNTF